MRDVKMITKEIDSHKRDACGLLIIRDFKSYTFKEIDGPQAGRLRECVLGEGVMGMLER